MISGGMQPLCFKVWYFHRNCQQSYLGKVNDTEAIRWIETLYGQSHFYGRGQEPSP